MNVDGAGLLFLKRGSDGELGKRFVSFTRTPTALNGWRLWFCCPGCRRRCRCLYGTIHCLAANAWGLCTPHKASKLLTARYGVRMPFAAAWAGLLTRSIRRSRPSHCACVGLPMKLCTVDIKHFFRSSSVVFLESGEELPTSVISPERWRMMNERGWRGYYIPVTAGLEARKRPVATPYCGCIFVSCLTLSGHLARQRIALQHRERRAPRRAWHSAIERQDSGTILPCLRLCRGQIARDISQEGLLAETSLIVPAPAQRLLRTSDRAPRSMLNWNAPPRPNP
jgi:hypothetical protein